MSVCVVSEKECVACNLSGKHDINAKWNLESVWESGRLITKMAHCTNNKLDANKDLAKWSDNEN